MKRKPTAEVFTITCPICNKPMAEHDELGATLHKLAFVLKLEREAKP